MAFSSFSKFLMKKWNNKLDTLVNNTSFLFEHRTYETSGTRSVSRQRKPIALLL